MFYTLIVSALNVLLASYYYKPHLGGVENSLFSLAKEYQKNGDQVYIMASDAGINKKMRLAQFELIDNIPVYRFRHFIPSVGIFHIFGPVLDIFYSWWLIHKLAKQIKIDLVITRHYIPAMGFVLFRKYSFLYLIPGIVKYQDTLELRKVSRTFKQKLIDAYRYVFLISQLNFIQLQVIRKASALFVFSETMMRQTIQAAGKGVLVKMNKVNPGVDEDRFYLQDKKALRQTKNIDINEFVFLSLGRITIHKGLNIAIDAFGIVLKKYPDKKLKLLIVGDGPELNSLKMHAKEKGIPDENVIFEGKTDIPEVYYALSDAFLMTSMAETFGQTIIEAMASGLPIIAFHTSHEIVTATSEIVTDKLHGVLCDYNTSLLANAMEECVTWTSFEREEISVRNKKYVNENYSWTKLAESLLKKKDNH